MNTEKIVICGDFLAQETEKIKIDRDIINCIQDSSFAICNFEAPIYSQGRAQIKSGPSLYQSIESPKFLEQVGFNMISLGNNHIMDFGECGLNSTINAFKNSTVFGAGTYDNIYNITVLESANIKIGVLSIVQYEFGVVEDNCAEKGTAWILSPLITDLIVQAKKELDFLIILPHAGLEDTDAPLPEWRNVYKRFIDLGASAIVATHPHAPQGWEIYKGAPIFYSLGNFYFDSYSDNINWYRSFMVELYLSDKLEFNVIPLAFSRQGQIYIDHSDDRKVHTNYINSLLVDNDKYNNYISIICEQVYKLYSYSLSRAVYAVPFRETRFIDIIKQIGYILLNRPNIPTLLNLFRCESHRWAIQYALRNKIY